MLTNSKEIQVANFGSSKAMTSKKHLLSSGLAAVISYTATNPLDRIMLMKQTS